MKAARKKIKHGKKPVKWFKKIKFYGKIDKGSVYVVVFLVSLIFGAFIFTGGVLPAKQPIESGQIVDTAPPPPLQPVVTSSNSAPYPTNLSAALQTTPIDCGYTLRGNELPELIWAYTLPVTTPATDNQPALIIYYASATAMPLGSVPMKTTPADTILNQVVSPTQLDNNQFPVDSPALFLTDITTIPGDKSGDAQAGGIPKFPSIIRGSWKPYNAKPLKDPTPNNGTNLGTAANPWPPTNGIDSGNGFDTTYTSEVIWKIFDLKTKDGNPLLTGHRYRVQITIHDGASPRNVASLCHIIAI